MLSVAEISNRIQNPHLVLPDDLSTLQELSEKYPYSQLFSILYLKALSSSGDPRFEEELGRHSYRISDRVQLYELIQERDQGVEIEKPATDVIAEEEKQVVSEVEDSNVEEPVVETPIQEQSPTEEDLSDSEEIEEETPVEEAKEEEEIVFEIESDHTPKPVDKLDESILHHVLAANYRLDDLTEEEQEKLESKQKQTEDAEPKEKVEEATSFTSWLHSNKNYTERDTSDKEAINAVVEDFSDFDPLGDLFGEVEKPKAEFFSPTKKAKKSLEESELPVSETLAKIYIMQGNYPQAITAYKQLSLAFPEKKIFFANLIEDLEKKINT